MSLQGGLVDYLAFSYDIFTWISVIGIVCGVVLAEVQDSWKEAVEYWE